LSHSPCHAETTGLCVGCIEDHRTERLSRMHNIGTGPFFCFLCGSKMEPSGHMMADLYLCPRHGEFTLPLIERVDDVGYSDEFKPEYISMGREVYTP
jgi:hypothetical protein